VVVLDVDEENRRLSLGHKQLEENPWDVFETVFTPGSIHKGTIMAQADKGMIVALPYGVEGFAPQRHLQKEDNTTPKVDEALDFKVIEFSKDNKKIILSHARVHQDASNAVREKEKMDNLSEEESTRRTVRKMKEGMEKTTLGDIEALANLKSDMEESEKAVLQARLKDMTKEEEKPADLATEEAKEE
jgi:small subunit ribosomal protein S1